MRLAPHRLHETLQRSAVGAGATKASLSVNLHRYSESDLVANRASLLLRGGGERDRRSWAEEAHRAFEAEGPLRTVTTGAELAAALAPPRGVVFIPDVLALSNAEQAQIIRCLQEREERPKIILGMSADPQAALTQGKLRSDLHYRLQQAQVDLSSSELKETIRARREAAEAALAKAQKALKAQAAPASRGAKAAPRKTAARSPKVAAQPALKKKPAAAARRPIAASRAKAKARPKPARGTKKR